MMTINRKTFSHALHTAFSAAAATSPIKELTGVLIENSIGCIEVTGYDMGMAITETIAGSVEDFKFVAPALLMNVVDKLAGEQIAMTLGDNVVTVTDGNSKFKISVMSAENYPELPKSEELRTVEVNDFPRLIKSTAYSAATQGNEVLQGILISVDDDITAVAMDGFRLAMAKAPCQSAEPLKAVVPAKYLSKLASLDGVCTLGFGAHYLVVESGNVRACARLISELYPDYKRIMRDNSSITVKVKTDELLDTVSRVKIVSDAAKKSRSAISCHIDDNWSVSSKATIGNATDTCPCESNGKIDIALNAAYLVDALKNVDSDEVTVGMESPTKAVQITTDAYTALIMPVRMED